MVPVLKRRFRLMHQRMERLHRTSQEQLSETVELRGPLACCLSLYDKLIPRIEAGHDDGLQSERAGVSEVFYVKKNVSSAVVCSNCRRALSSMKSS